MFFKSSLNAALLAASSISLASITHAQAVYYTAGHGDIGIEYELGSGEFEPHWHIGSGAVVNGVTLSSENEYAPDQIIAWTTSTFAAPTGSATWLGVAEGADVFRMGNSTFQPNLGWATEEVGIETDWVGETITIELSGWSGSNPGEFALIAGGNALFSTFGGSTNNWVFDVASGHAHAAFYFSDPGYYELTFTWTGEHVVDGLVTGTGTFGFQAGAIPEPSSAAALAGLVSLGFVTLRRQRRA